MSGLPIQSGINCCFLAGQGTEAPIRDCPRSSGTVGTYATTDLPFTARHSVRQLLGNGQQNIYTGASTEMDDV